MALVSVHPDTYRDAGIGKLMLSAGSSATPARGPAPSMFAFALREIWCGIIRLISDSGKECCIAEMHGLFLEGSVRHPPVRLVAFLGVLFSLYAFGQTTKAIPFTAEGVQSIAGEDVCAFQGEFPTQFGVDLDRSKEHAVQYRERNGIIAVFLLSRPVSRCGIVDAVLDLTSVIRKGETVEFKCYTAHEGGTTLGKWGHVIGLADNENGLKRFVRARLAWSVDVKEKRFEELKGHSVTCDTTGYSD
jgi:hypothetical protein